MQLKKWYARMEREGGNNDAEMPSKELPGPGLILQDFTMLKIKIKYATQRVNLEAARETRCWMAQTLRHPAEYRRVKQAD